MTSVYQNPNFFLTTYALKSQIKPRLFLRRHICIRVAHVVKSEKNPEFVQKIRGKNPQGSTDVSKET